VSEFFSIRISRQDGAVFFSVMHAGGYAKPPAFLFQAGEITPVLSAFPDDLLHECL